MRYHKIPDETVRRLPIYLRGLMFSAEKGREHISSKSLADYVGVNAWQIRKDFSYFGDFGTPGVGYNIERQFQFRTVFETSECVGDLLDFPFGIHTIFDVQKEREISQPSFEIPLLCLQHTHLFRVLQHLSSIPGSQKTEHHNGCPYD